MKEVMSACGVLCSGCAAFRGDVKGVEHQERSAAAWRRIYRMKVTSEQMACGGCLAPDEEVYPSSRTCKARNCCRAKGFTSCAECGETASCPMLAKAQSVWDGVPKIAATLSPADFEAYAKPYLDPRRRLTAARASRSR
jgi:Protein of unknown function (DUF3795)